MDPKEIGSYLGYFAGFVTVFLAAGKYALKQLIEKTKENQALHAVATKQKFDEIKADTKELKTSLFSLKEKVDGLEKSILLGNADTKALQVNVERIERVLDQITQVNVVSKEAPRLEEKPIGGGAFTKLSQKKKP